MRAYRRAWTQPLLWRHAASEHTAHCCPAAARTLMRRVSRCRYLFASLTCLIRAVVWWHVGKGKVGRVPRCMACYAAGTRKKEHAAGSNTRRGALASERRGEPAEMRAGSAAFARVVSSIGAPPNCSFAVCSAYVAQVRRV